MYVSIPTASIPAVHNILPFWLAKKIFALAKYLWSLYWQWRYSTPTKSETDSTTEEQSHETSAKSSEKTTKGVNGNVDVHKSGSGSDVETAKEAEGGASSDGDREGTKARRRRGKWVPEELHASARQEEDKPYVPPAYYCEDEEINSDEDSESDIDEPSQLQLQHTSSSHAQSQVQEVGINSTEANTEYIKQDNTVDDVQEMNNKSVEDVCALSMAGKKIDIEDDESTGASCKSASIVMVSNSKDGSTSSSWSRHQQKQLEWALVQYPKFAKDRWDNIAKAVPGKNKVMCVYTSLVKYCIIVCFSYKLKHHSGTWDC